MFLLQLYTFYSSKKTNWKSYLAKARKIKLFQRVQLSLGIRCKAKFVLLLLKANIVKPEVKDLLDLIRKWPKN